MELWRQREESMNFSNSPSMVVSFSCFAGHCARTFSSAIRWFFDYP